jgi:hypothetical protein
MGMTKIPANILEGTAQTDAVNTQATPFTSNNKSDLSLAPPEFARSKKEPARRLKQKIYDSGTTTNSPHRPPTGGLR